MYQRSTKRPLLFPFFDLSSSAGCTSCPLRTSARRHADTLAMGEGVQIWPRILRDFERRRLQQRYRGSYTRRAGHVR